MLPQTPGQGPKEAAGPSSHLPPRLSLGCLLIGCLAPPRWAEVDAESRGQLPGPDWCPQLHAVSLQSGVSPAPWGWVTHSLRIAGRQETWSGHGVGVGEAIVSEQESGVFVLVLKGRV